MVFQPETVQIITPSVVRVQHFGYILGNGVKCIIIHDPTTKVPAAAMNIHAGHLNDPEALPGLAHLCEHMLFMGTAKYPREDEYSNYITKNSGQCNAWTADRGTSYYFTIAHNALEGALERFVEFFVAPSFSHSSLSREVRAVHSEDEKNHSIDFWRIDELERSFVDTRHPRSRYGNGNITTLWDEPLSKKVDVWQRLVEFYNSYYVSEAACMVVYSALPVESVLKIIEAPLLRMRTGSPAKFHFLPPDEPLSSASEKRLWVNVRTVRKTRSIRLSWYVKSPSTSWRSMPGSYISHVLGHECNSSVLGVLKRKNMATAMVVGPRRVDSDNEILCVDIALTVDGFKRILEVIDLVYQGIGQASHVDSKVYSQMKAEGKLAFESSEIHSSVDHCIELAYSANETDLQHCWIGGEVVIDDDIAAEEAYMAQLIPENSTIMLKWGEMPCEDLDSASSPAANDENNNEENDEENDEEVESTEEDNVSVKDLFQSLPEFARVACNNATRFHNAKFSKCHIPDEILKRWTDSLYGPRHNELALPPENPFIAKDFTVFKSNDTHPVIETLHIPYGVTLVRKDSGHHNSFKTSIRWNGLSPCAYASPKNRFYTRVMESILNDSIAEISYFGLLAALENCIQRGTGGLRICVTGPQDRIIELFLALLEQSFTLSVLLGSEEKYSIYAEENMRNLMSCKSRQPYELANDCFLKASMVIMYTFDEVLSASKSASYDEYKLFVKNYLKSGIYFECFIAGNVPSSIFVRDYLIKGINEIMNRLEVPPAQKELIPRFRDTYAISNTIINSNMPILDVLIYPPFESENPNVSVLLNIYLGEETPTIRALSDCMHNLISSSFFDALRTKEALGYIVFSRSLRLEGTAHLQFMAQSAEKGINAIYLISRIIAFLMAVEENLNTICSNEEVKTVINGLIEVRRKLPDSIDKDCGDLSKSYLHPIGLDHKEAEIEALEKLDATKLKDFFLSYIANSCTSRQALAVVINNAASAASDSFGETDQAYNEVLLPPQRLNKSNVDGVNDENLKLPDFRDNPMRIAVRRHMSPEDYHSSFSIVCSKSI